jgi:outer membrane protein assembly factor BamD (BamD/ComL family)
MMSAEVQHRLSGTIPYMAPEQLKEETRGTQRSDLYSLGVVVYETLTGQLPYRGRDVGLIYQVTTSEPLPPTTANPELPKGVEPVLLQALDKDPAKRYSSCMTFAEELGKAAQAYVVASEKYGRARALFDTKRWRNALAAFHDLESQAPGFKDAVYYLEQARHQVRLLELYERAQKSLEQGRHQDTLDTLNMLTQLAPDYDVANLRTRAQQGLAQEEKRSLDDQYQQAVRQCQNQEYQACLDTLAVIRKRSPGYPDSEGIEANAQEQVERQRLLHDLYTQSVSQMSQEQWKEAIVTFQKLQKAAPGYEDVVARLVTCRHLARLTSYLREARDLLDQGAFTACKNRLDELQRIDDEYKRDEVTGLHQEVLNRLHGRIESLLTEGRFEDSLAALAELRSLAPDYLGLDEPEKQAREGIRIRDLQAELDNLYRQAEEHLGRSSYVEAFRLWQGIQQRKGNLDYPDARNVEKRAREGLCISLYGQALVALDQGEPQQAFKLWHQVHQVDPNYPDNRRIEQRARAMDLYRQALEALDKKKNPHLALELWHQVRKVDSSYRDSQQVEPRAQAMTLYDQALEALVRQDPQRALELWRQVRAKESNYQDSQRVEPRAQAMNLYNQALAALGKAEYRQALELWRQVREVDPHFPDNKRVEQRANAMGLYSQALGALAQKDPQRALELWHQVRATDPQYPDSQEVEQQAQAIIRRRKAQRLGFFLGGGAGIIVVLLIGIFALTTVMRSCLSPTATPTPATMAVLPVISTAALTQTPTPTPIITTSTPTAVTPTAASAATPTRTPSPTPTTPTPTPTPAAPTSLPTPDNLATAIQGASIFAAPNVNSQTLGSVSRGEQVSVLGRSAVGRWYYVRDDQGVEGFVYIDRLEWPGDYEALPTKTPIATSRATAAPRATPIPRTPSSPLAMDLWDLSGTEKCDGDIWLKSVFIQGHGGNGVYTYYWNGEKLVGPTGESHTFELHSTGGAIVGTGKVVSGDGQVERELYIRKPDCN